MTTAIVKLLDSKSVLLNINAESAVEIITELGNELFKNGYVKDTFVDAVITREKTMPTGLPLLGDINAAIPHTDIEHVIKPGLAMATLQNAVNFQNMAEPEKSVPVRLVFLLALEQPKAQIEMLQEIATVLQNPEIVSNLLKAKDFNEAIDALTDADC
jgi:PTS system galactitol-specific IIA component